MFVYYLERMKYRDDDDRVKSHHRPEIDPVHLERYDGFTHVQKAFMFEVDEPGTVRYLFKCSHVDWWIDSKEKPEYEDEEEEKQ